MSSVQKPGLNCGFFFGVGACLLSIPKFFFASAMSFFRCASSLICNSLNASCSSLNNLSCSFLFALASCSLANCSASACSCKPTTSTCFITNSSNSLLFFASLNFLSGFNNFETLLNVDEIACFVCVNKSSFLILGLSSNFRFIILET